MNHKHMPLLFVFFLSLVVVLLSACSPSTQQTTSTQMASQQTQESSIPSAPASQTKEVTIDMFDWDFTQSDVTINKGDTVRIRVTSSQGTHGIMFPGLGLSTNRIAEGEEQIIEFVAEESGPIEYFCNVPCGTGHRSMRGQLMVQ